MRKLDKIGLVLLIVFVILAPATIYISMPQLLNRETTPLFIIDNHDAKAHEVHLEIYHGENELVFNQTYEITSYETFRYEERLSFFREYSFKVILNEEFEKTYEMRETFSNSLVIQLYKDEIPLNLDVI